MTFKQNIEFTILVLLASIIITSWMSILVSSVGVSLIKFWFREQEGFVKRMSPLGYDPGVEHLNVH
jgi:hypothetical protein